MTNSAAPRGAGGLLARRRRGGTGLAGLRARVEAAGGTLRAGAAEDGGWRVCAVFPAEAGAIR